MDPGLGNQDGEEEMLSRESSEQSRVEMGGGEALSRRRGHHCTPLSCGGDNTEATHDGSQAQVFTGWMGNTAADSETWQAEAQDAERDMWKLGRSAGGGGEGVKKGPGPIGGQRRHWEGSSGKGASRVTRVKLGRTQKQGADWGPPRPHLHHGRPSNVDMGEDFPTTWSSEVRARGDRESKTAKGEPFYGKRVKSHSETQTALDNSVFSPCSRWGDLWSWKDSDRCLKPIKHHVAGSRESCDQGQYMLRGQQRKI